MKFSKPLFFILPLFFLLPVVAIGGDKNEVQVYSKTGLLFNSNCIRNKRGSSEFTKVRNSIVQNIGVTYTKVLKNGILLSGGLDAGVEKYKVEIQYPFEKYGFVRPANLGEQYKMEATIPFVQANLNIGYRFQEFKKFPLEFRIGQILNLPLDAERFGYESRETSYTGLMSSNFLSIGSFGKIDKKSIVGEFITSVYVGCAFQSHSSFVRKYNVGLQFQRRLILTNTDFSYFSITYRDANGNIVSEEEFRTMHNSLALVLGITF